MVVANNKLTKNHTLFVPEYLLNDIPKDIKQNSDNLSIFLLDALKIGLLSISQAGVQLSTESYYKQINDLHNNLITTLDKYVGNNEDSGLIRASIDDMVTDTDWALARALDYEDVESPFYNLNLAISDIKTKIIELNTKIDSKQNYDKLLSKSTIKGKNFEESVALFLKSICKHRAIIDLIGANTSQGSQSKTGDILIKLPDNHSIVVECKSGNFTMSGASSLEKELEKAKITRNADFAIGVVTKTNKKSTMNVIDIYENHAYVVVDQDNFDYGFLALEAAFIAICYKLKASKTVIVNDADMLLKESSKFVNIINTKINDLQIVNNSVTQIEKSSKAIRDVVDQIKLDMLREITNIQKICKL